MVEINTRRVFRIMADNRSIVWRKSPYSDQVQCVEVAVGNGQLLVRDSKNPDGPRLTLQLETWRRFTALAKAGRLDV
jgi:hypothetical protein